MHYHFIIFNHFVVLKLVVRLAAFLGKDQVASSILDSSSKKNPGLQGVSGVLLFELCGGYHRNRYTRVCPAFQCKVLR